MSKELMRYQPSIGYTYMPNTKVRVPWGKGGYLVRTNAAGFRADREFVHDRTPGTFRALVFGDSQTAGEGVANAQRFTDLVERALPGIELYNYAVSGTGPDQQFLIYQECAGVEHDLVIIALYVESIRRANARVVKWRDASGEEYFRAKPYYDIQDDELVLHHVPVPKQPWTEQTVPPELLPYLYPPRLAQQRHAAWMLGGAGRLAGLRRSVKAAAMRFERFRPMPEFDSPDNPRWVLPRRILEAWIRTSPTPVLVIPIPHYFFLQSPTASLGYRARLRELAAATGCHLYDPLPDLSSLSTDERSELWSDSSGHLSIRGHQTLANLFVPVLQTFMPAAHAQRAAQ